MTVPESAAATDRNFIRSIEKGLTVLTAFSASNPTYTLAELARRTGLSRAALRRILLTLHQLGYVGSRGREYFLLPKVLELGYAYVSSTGMAGLVQPHLDNLNGQIGEACSVGVLSSGEVVYLARAQSRRMLTAVMGAGVRLNAAATAIGRVLLAGLDDDTVNAHLRDHPTPPYTPFTLTEPEEILAEVRRVRLRGWTMVDQELEIGFRVLAVPLRAPDGRYFAALNVGMHSSRIDEETAMETVLPAMRATAVAIERDLTLHPMPF